jgi:hypothetical protein
VQANRITPPTFPNSSMIVVLGVFFSLLLWWIVRLMYSFTDVNLPRPLPGTASTSGTAFSGMARWVALPWWRKLALKLLAAVPIVLLLRAFVLGVYVVPTASMGPEIPQGSRVLV